jgi:hypothetical protein
MAESRTGRMFLHVFMRTGETLSIYYERKGMTAIERSPKRTIAKPQLHTRDGPRGSPPPCDHPR